MVVGSSCMLTGTPQLPPTPLHAVSEASVLVLTHSPPTELNLRHLLLQQCRTMCGLHQLHSHLIKTGLHFRPSIAENLLECAALIVPDALWYAFEVFDKMPRRTTPTYSVMIRGLTSKKLFWDAISLLAKMLEESVVPDKYSFCCTLKACARVGAVDEGKVIHGLVLKTGCLSKGFVESTLIHMYASCGLIDVARVAFDAMPDKDLVAWNAMSAGYSKAGDWTKVVELFCEMVGRGIEFDEVTLISVLTACGKTGNLELGEWIGGYMERNGLKGNMNLVTSLVDMYAKCGKVDKARELFDEMSDRDVVSWSAMISGYSQSHRCREALHLFHEMQSAGMEPNEVTMVSVLSSCAVLGAFETGRWVDSFIKRKGLHLTVNLGTALVDFYAKCGAIESSFESFKRMPKKNVLSWTVLIHGLASNGKGKEALSLFSSMIEANVQPNDVTFIGVLLACSHAGFVEDGRHFFEVMSRDYGIVPRIDHYGCMVDMLGRAGLLEEAFRFIKSMPIKPNAVVWRMLLASCRVHKNVKIGEQSLKEIIKLEPIHSGDYILLSNIYASVGRLADSLRVRAEMKEKGIKKPPGCTLIEVEGMIHEFFAEDSQHPQYQEIYFKIEEIIANIKLAGYVPKIEEARLDAEENEKEIAVSHHSEKLAIAFGLIKTSEGTAIRISKNLRVCTDCHFATKLISKVYEREIIVRDRNRFHHFIDGSCSCNDYW